MAGDIFLLGSHLVAHPPRRGGRVRVEDAHGLPPTMPFWNGEGLARTAELSREVAELREELWRAAGRRAARSRWLVDECALERGGAEQALRLRRRRARRRSARCRRRRLRRRRALLRRGGRHAAGHPRAVRRAHQPRLGAGAAQEVLPHLRLRAAGGGHRRRDPACRSARSTASRSTRSSASSRPHTVEETLVQAALQSPMWETRWRWNATRALAVLRFTGGQAHAAAAVAHARGRSDGGGVSRRRPAARTTTAASCARTWSCPIIRWCSRPVRDCLQEAMDVDGLRARARARSPRGDIECLARDTVAPSPWAHAILNAMPYTFLDDAPLEERRARAVKTARPASRARDLGIARRRRDPRGAWPRPSPIRATPTSCTICCARPSRWQPRAAVARLVRGAGRQPAAPRRSATAGSRPSGVPSPRRRTPATPTRRCDDGRRRQQRAAAAPRSSAASCSPRAR